MILAHNGIYFKKGFWYLEAYLHCDPVSFCKEGGTDKWMEWVDNEWQPADEFDAEDCEELLKEFTRG